jgi:hypothetical protein
MGADYSERYFKGRVCLCGCGKNIFKRGAKKDSQRKFIVGHYKRKPIAYKTGANHPNWRGGWVNSIGYHCQIVHTGGKSHTVLTHRLVMENMLGRKLRKGEVVDHIDNNKTNKIGRAHV